MQLLLFQIAYIKLLIYFLIKSEINQFESVFVNLLMIKALYNSLYFGY